MSLLITKDDDKFNFSQRIWSFWLIFLHHLRRISEIIPLKTALSILKMKSKRKLIQHDSLAKRHSCLVLSSKILKLSFAPTMQNQHNFRKEHVFPFNLSREQTSSWWTFTSFINVSASTEEFFVSIQLRLNNRVAEKNHGQTYFVVFCCATEFNDFFYYFHLSICKMVVSCCNFDN